MAYATVEELAGALRIRLTAENTPGLQACLDAAAEEIDHTVAALDGQDPATASKLANRVNILRGVEWWKANDAAFGVIGYDDTGALQAPRNGFRRHAASLIPLKQQWGIG
jgi:hypothetical protein